MIRIVASDPTAAELQAVLSHPEAFFEVVDGEIVEKPKMSVFSQLVARRLYKLMDEVATAGRSGTVVHEWMFAIDADRPLKRRPDIAFVSYERWPADREVPEQGDWEVVPDLAIEVISPRDLSGEVALKIREYLRYGVKQVWVVHPESRAITVHYTSPRRIEEFEEGDILEGGPILPGLRITVGDLFRRTVG